MTAQVIYHPSLADGCDRLIEQQRAANIAAEGQPVDLYAMDGDLVAYSGRDADEMARYENYRTAKAVLRGPHWYSADVVHAALAFTHEYETSVPRHDAHATVRRRFVDHYEPDHPRPHDLGLIAVISGLAVAGVAALLLHWAGVLL